VNPAFQEAAVAHAHQLRTELPGVDAVLLSTADGREIAGVADDRFDRSRLAALSSSLCALGDVVAAEAAQGASRCVLVETAAGFVLLQNIPKPEFPMVLTLVASAETVLGMAKYRLGLVAQELAVA
jgi:predicted regulator of Ras-like GTPase activity (Roadblock/LC7/MglB family)